MKNLFKKSTIAFVALSLFVISCEKPKVPPPAEPEPKMVLIAALLDEDDVPHALSDDELKAAKKGTYEITPILPVSSWGCNGKKKWGHKVTIDTKDVDHGFKQDPDTGIVRLDARNSGTYTVTITYSCNNVIVPGEPIIITVI